MRNERYTGWNLFKDVCYKTDRKLKQQHQDVRVPAEVINIVRYTPAHKPETRDGRGRGFKPPSR
jgi:ribosomal protein L13E